MYNYSSDDVYCNNMDFAGKAYLRRRSKVSENKINFELAQDKEEVKIPQKIEEKEECFDFRESNDDFNEDELFGCVGGAKAPKLKRQRSTERLSISSLNHSLNSNSSDDDSEEERDHVPVPVKEAKPKIELKVDTNVVSLNLTSLKEAVIVSTGDPILCHNCEAVFSMFSKLSELDENRQVWLCEFCGFENIVNVDAEEIPRGSTVD